MVQNSCWLFCCYFSLIAEVLVLISILSSLGNVLVSVSAVLTGSCTENFHTSKAEVCCAVSREVAALEQKKKYNKSRHTSCLKDQTVCVKAKCGAQTSSIWHLTTFQGCILAGKCSLRSIKT